MAEDKKKFKIRKWRVIRLCIAAAIIAAVVILLAVRCDRSFNSVYDEAMSKSGIKYRSSEFLASETDSDVPVAEYVKKSGMYRYTADVNGKSRILTDALYTDARPATRMIINGTVTYVAAVCDNTGWGYIRFTASGNTLSAERLLELRFENCEPYREGIAAVCSGGLYGFIDIAGNYIIYPEYNDVRFCAKGLIPVKTGAEWYYVDTNNSRVLGPYAEAESFSADGIACVKMQADGLFMYIDTAGNAVTDELYEDAWESNNGLAYVKHDGKWTEITVINNDE